MKNRKLVYCLTALACVCFVNCENPIMKKWWMGSEPQEVEYVPIVKMIPQVTYATIIEHDVVNQVIIQQLPPEVIYQTIIQEVKKEVPVYIYETVIEKVPEIIYETVTEYQTVYEPIVEEVPVYVYETVIQEIPVYVYETIIEKEIEEKTVYETVYQTVYETVYQTVHDTVTIIRDPTEDEIKDYIRDHETEIIELIKDDPDFDKLIKEYIMNHMTEVIELIKNDPDFEDIIKEIIQTIPPDELITYLTDEQIKYIIQQQPPQIILQTIDIIDIEYIIFAGNAIIYNGPHAAGANTDLTPQEKSSNDAAITAMAQSLKDHPDYLMILHGHANPTSSNPSEVEDLMTISKARADAVNVVLKEKFSQLGGDITGWDTRVSSKGYGGEKNLTVTDSIYSGLNRRVEMILVRIGVEQ